MPQDLITFAKPAELTPSDPLANQYDPFSNISHNDILKNRPINNQGGANFGNMPNDNDFI